MLSFYLALIDDDCSRILFEQIYMLYRHTMVYAANRILHDQMLAEDATHDAFLRIMNHLDKITEPDCNKTRGFVVLIVRNIAVDYYRKMNRKPEVSYDEMEFAIQDDGMNPEVLYQQNESLVTLEKSISELGPKYVEILTLKYSFDYSDQEIAQLLGVSCSTVRTRLHRARNQLRLKLEEEGV
jgi:RNA polymerase sigma-70 factor (ECF subfamily)